MTITYCDACGVKVAQATFGAPNNIQHVYDAAGQAKVVCTGCRKDWMKRSKEFFSGAPRGVGGDSDTPQHLSR